MRINKLATVNKSESAVEMTLGPGRDSGEVASPSKQDKVKEQHSIIVSEKGDKDLKKIHTGRPASSSQAAASLKQHSVTEQLLSFKRYKEKSNLRNFMKAYMYDSIVKSLLIILDECIKSREKFAVDRTRRFAREFEQVRKL